MVNTKCIKINDKTLKELKNDFNNYLNVKEVQTYFPILSLFFEYYNDSDTSFILNSNFLVTSLNESINQAKMDSYIKHFFKASILNQNNNETFEKNLFVKILPILNVSQSMMNEYNVNHSSRLPNIHSSLTSKKINNYNNSAYIDSFFSYLGSILTEQGKCPTFPLFFGTYSGVVDEFKYDITEEYNSIKHTSWYKKYNNKLFRLESIDLDPFETNSLYNLSPNSVECDNLNELINDNDIHIDSDQNSDVDSVKNSDVDSVKNSDGDSEKNSDVDSVKNSDGDSEKNSDGDSEKNSDGDSVKNSDGDSDGDSVKNSDGDSDGDSEKNSDVDSDSDSEGVKNSDGYISGDSINLDDVNLCDSISLNSESNFSLSSSDMYEINYCCFKDYPVQINCIEMLEYTLDNYIEKTNNNIPEIEWKSILFQICFGLSVAQKNYNFVHNDLHSSNIMFKESKLEYIYFSFKGTYFKIPTFGKITKIIDFGRATFNYKNKLFFSDVFKKNGEAEGQYNYPYYNNLNNCKIKPNNSFDLSRLATTIIEHFEEDTHIYKLLKLWCMDKYGNFLMDLNDDFNLYRIIAKNVKSAVPKNQINKLIFKEFIVEKDSIINEFIYNY